MKPYQSLLGLGTLALLVVAAQPADAAWNNVFQVTCCQRRPQTANYVAVPVIANSAPGCCAPPPTVCTTQYQQRCYYQPITTYQTKTYYEPVTTYRTSYYYEPVTSYRYSCYYDPCSCSYQQVAQPVTSYQIRSKSCPVQSWVQRCCSVPVTVMQKSCYWEPQTSCSSCNTCAPTVVPTQAVAPPVITQPLAPMPPVTTPPTDAYKVAPPVISEQQNFNPQQQQQPRFEQNYAPTPLEPPMGSGSSFKQPYKQPPVPPAVKLDRITFAIDGAVQGQVVHNNAPQAGAKVIFVHASLKGQTRTLTANASGQFQANLATGGYLVYVNDQQGRPVFHSRIDVDGQQPTVMQLVRR